MVGGALSFLPAGLGGMESLFAALLFAQGVNLDHAVEIVVITRVLTLWFAVAIGALALVYSAYVKRDISFR
jgi:uncharacterized membrane protein YbhN (UPF0104 family)